MGKSKKFPVKDEDFRKSSWTKVFLCVLVAKKKQGIAVRDSKDPSKTTLFFTPGEWNAFVRGVKGGEFD